MIGMGIADGVYQWREQGIDAGEFSRLLMHTALEAVEEGQPDVLKGLQLPQLPPLGARICVTCTPQTAGRLPAGVLSASHPAQIPAQTRCAVNASF